MIRHLLRKTFPLRCLAYSPVFSFAKFSREKAHVNVGTIGHIDHGKTTLTSAITLQLSKKGKDRKNDHIGYCKHFKYEDIDRAPEEKSRGITINSFTLEYETDHRHFSHVDCPGHADYVKNMITGAARMDVGILVVSGADGAMAQTKEHILLCKQSGVKYIVVYVNKMDMVKDMEMFQLVEMEVREYLDQYGFDGKNAFFVKGAARFALTGENPELGEKSIDELIQVLDNKMPLPERLTDKPFVMSVDHTITLKGRGGVVATGTIESGKVKAKDEVEIVGYRRIPIRSHVRSVETFNKSLEVGLAGDNVGVLLRNIEPKELCRGMCITKPGTLSLARNFSAKIYVLKVEEGGRKIPFKSNFQPQCFIRTADVPVKLTLPSNVKMAIPGDSLELVGKLDKPLPINVGTKFVFREGGKTVAYGVMTQVFPDTKEDLENDEARDRARGKKSVVKAKVKPAAT